MKSLLLPTGLALVLSFAGFFFSRIRVAPRKDLPRLPSPSTEADGCKIVDDGPELEEELKPIHDEELSPKSIGDMESLVVVEVPSKSPSSGDDEGYLLPEFNELVFMEFEAAVKEPNPSSIKTLTPERTETMDLSTLDKEISNLKNLVQYLQEREKKLEFQLLEYYGLKEQKSSVVELEKQLREYCTEARILSMQIDCLQADNRNLETQLADYSGVTEELEIARERIRLLEREMWSNSEQAEEMLDALRERLEALQASEEERKQRNAELECGLLRLNNLEEEAAKLRNENSKLTQENLVLVEKLEHGPVPASCRPKPKAMKALEEVDQLQKANEELRKAVHQLQIDRSADVEELVFLKWLNACLRFELKDYRHPEGRTLGNDLGNISSPKSEEKAKQLILEYVNSGNNENVIADFHSDCCSSSPSSLLTEFADLDDSSTSTKESSSSSKVKFFGKLKKLVLGKGAHGSKSSKSDQTWKGHASAGGRASMPDYSPDDMLPRHSFDSASSCLTMEHGRGNPVMSAYPKAEEHSLEEARVMRNDRCKSDLGSSPARLRFALGTQRSSVHSIHTDGESVDFPEKEEMKKFANALMNTARSPQFRRKAGP